MPMRSLGPRYYKLNYQTKTNPDSESELRLKVLGIRLLTPKTRSPILMSDEDLGLVPEANPVGLITTTVSETPPAGMVNIADELVESVEKDLIIHVVHLPDENLGLVPETDPAGTITIADELVVDETNPKAAISMKT
ncbi:hypothetical protein BGX38DRAFT_1142291 [Terfezia claveryi]|nr:hypothetical protein BGX38DRAFT_1142291 [Terfezia claveryi]